MHKMATVKKRKMKYWKRYIYILAVILIVVTSVFFALQGKDEWSEVKYGTTSDGYVAVTNVESIEVEFSVSDVNLQGFYIKLQSEIKEFNQEQLIFTLFDEHKTRIIDEYIMDLKYVLPQAKIFVPITCGNAAEEKVVLRISGRNITNSTVPHLYISESYDNKSELTVGGFYDDTHYLVMSEVYKVHQDVNVGALGKGVLYLLLLMIAFCWNRWTSVDGRAVREN